MPPPQPRSPHNHHILLQPPNLLRALPIRRDENQVFQAGEIADRAAHRVELVAVALEPDSETAQWRGRGGEGAFLVLRVGAQGPAREGEGLVGEVEEIADGVEDDEFRGGWEGEDQAAGFEGFGAGDSAGFVARVDEGVLACG